MIVLSILIVVVFWPDLVEAAHYVTGLGARQQVRRQAQLACEDLDDEYERLMRSHR